MKLANNINVRVFCREEEDKPLIIKKLKSLLPFDMETEKIAIEEQHAEGFADRKIPVIKVVLEKNKHVNAFIENLVAKLEDEKKTLLEQLNSRLDNDLNFFIRLSKEMLLKDKLIVTDSGNCYHIRINIASFPKKREKAIEVLKDMLS